ncbi:MAG TPA: TusE/DsrC/DsvC family sulfur relay protein [Syntrophorhabdaceae bacterium]|nr:TusE/DsrC/DsvC family sulfur relay protein [Syntrophorhabdaceae bacterium]
MDGLSEPEERTWDLQQRVRVIAGKEVVFDDEGFLWRPEDWTEEVGRMLASETGMEGLDDDQWRVIRFLREYYAYHGRAPMNRDLKAGLGMSLMDLEALFPGGIRKGARRIAGLPNPRSCT